MKITSRDRRINGIIADLRAAAATAACILTIECSAKSLIKWAPYAEGLINSECDAVTIKDDGVHYRFEMPFGPEVGVINHAVLTPVLAPGDDDDDLPF